MPRPRFGRRGRWRALSSAWALWLRSTTRCGRPRGPHNTRARRGGRCPPEGPKVGKGRERRKGWKIGKWVAPSELVERLVDLYKPLFRGIIRLPRDLFGNGCCVPILNGPHDARCLKRTKLRFKSSYASAQVDRLRVIRLDRLFFECRAEGCCRTPLPCIAGNEPGDEASSPDQQPEYQGESSHRKESTPRDEQKTQLKAISRPL